MIKKVIICLFYVLIISLFVGCANNKKSNNNISNDNLEVSQMNAIIDGKEYTIDLEDNDTVKDFVSILPKEFTMSELNGNEYYVYMDTSLKSNPERVEKIYAGDVMLYEDNCIVIFYKSFDTKYKYTKIGHISSLPELKGEKMSVKFDLK